MGKAGTDGREIGNWELGIGNWKLVLWITIFHFLFTISQSRAQVPIVKFKYLDSLFHSRNDTTYLINFWATWCNPCVHELPFFEELRENYKDKKLSIILL